ncbi:hypothetical protein K505DRAFT_324805 [Melanomma pulvis-pyrius CBS 109.77]|uniref:Mucoidy inhibitor-like protein n=1 Tax=Melanomma pulvis-pyrius CBS 109.77 TaxID=1314802 RepID=A0A6A6XET5_9PLEO|nr:hypothetical protein K505DRAFT_324805 [Melanomma pulvis-pyrius CBS 109.77]
MFGRTVDIDQSMPTDASTQVFNISNLSTKSVTLYPTRAHITREIGNVLLKPGVNEVVIYGLSPTVDEHSIQIEGQGVATIVDMTVELVPNRDIFEETYPDESESSDDDSEPDFRDSDDEEEAVKEISEELKDLKLQITETTEIQNSATERLLTLDRYSKSATAEHLTPDNITKLNQKYEEERASIFKVHSAATLELEKLKKQIIRKENEKVRAGKEAKKQEEKTAKQKAKDRRRRELQKTEKRKEASYVKQEKLRYWAKKVYKVTLLLEGASLDTPGSSRRNSMDSVTLASSTRPDPKTMKSSDEELTGPQTAISLLLSYVTKEAGWSPRYDIRISSLQKTATIIYRTEFLNRTSEIWKDAKLSFSTSQTSYQGLDDVVPFMHAWRIKLSRHISGDGGLLSAEEAQKSRSGRPALDTFKRADYFGLDDNFIPAWQSKRPLHVQQVAQSGGLFGSSQVKSASTFRNPTLLTTGYGGNSNGWGSNTGGSGLFGSAPGAQNEKRLEAIGSDVVQASTEMSASIGRARKSNRGSLFSTSRKKESNNDANDNPSTHYGDEDEDEESTIDPVDFEETSWEDNGLTATYDVPGVRTLIPSSMTRRHKIASLNASNISLSHICVPKLRSAAFLRAKIRNPSSSVTLLKGSAGVTLDGSFLGNMKLPRVSPSQVFDLPLGVDPAIHVNYPKPSVHRSTQGLIFNKESAQVFTRSVWLNNTKSQPVDLLVLDQIPVSEDERLRVVITTPRGLTKEGDSVKAGQSAKEGSSGAVAVVKGQEWGNAVAKLKKNGEVDWMVKLEKGQGCLLKLEYEAKLPPSERIVPA